MSFQTIVSKLIDSVKVEVNKPEHMGRIREDIIKPLVSQVLEELYPYVIGVVVVSVVVVLMIVAILCLNLKICYKS